jgi:hypothetical protein
MPLDRSFLSLLSQTALLQRHTGTDQWGNESYGPSETIKCFYSEESTGLSGVEDDTSGQTEPRVTAEGEIITDAIGMRPGDRLVPPHSASDPTSTDYRFAVRVTTNLDESGVPLYQTSTLARKPTPVTTTP